MKKTFLVSAALFASLTMADIAPADASTTYFASCTSLHKTFRYGVAKSHAAALYQVRTRHYQPSYTAYAQKVYWVNYKRLDRDRDGTACEVTR